MQRVLHEHSYKTPSHNYASRFELMGFESLQMSLSRKDRLRLLGCERLSRKDRLRLLGCERLSRTVV